jgi:hypothetical protein
MSPHELADGGVAGKVTPSEDGTEQLKSPRVAALEAEGDRDGLVLAQKSVFGCEAVVGDSDFSSGCGVKVSHPIGIGSPRRADHDLAVVGFSEDHRHRVVRLPTRATHVHEHEEGSAEHPAPTARVQPRRHPEHG